MSEPIFRAWRKTSEQLPIPKDENEDQTLCLVIGIHGEGICIRAYNHFHKCWDDEDLDDNYCETLQIKYWMPLPAYPELLEQKQ